MPTIATDTFRLSHLVKKELWPEKGFCRLEVTVNEATAKTYAVGTVLGKVTADGKYKIAVQTAVDGSAVAAAIVLDDHSIAATTDTKIVGGGSNGMVVKYDCSGNSTTINGSLYGNFVLTVSGNFT